MNVTEVFAQIAETVSHYDQTKRTNPLYKAPDPRGFLKNLMGHLMPNNRTDSIDWMAHADQQLLVLGIPRGEAGVLKFIFATETGRDAQTNVLGHRLTGFQAGIYDDRSSKQELNLCQLDLSVSQVFTAHGQRGVKALKLPYFSSMPPSDVKREAEATLAALNPAVEAIAKQAQGSAGETYVTRLLVSAARGIYSGANRTAELKRILQPFGVNKI